MKGEKLLILLSVIISVAADKKTFEGYKVYKVVPKTHDEVELLQRLQAQGVVELWDDIYETNRDVRMMVSPRNVEIVHSVSVKSGMEIKEVISDMQKAINKQLNSVPTERSNSFLSFSWEIYHNLEDIYKWMDDLKQEYPGIVDTYTIGTSVEGRPIRGIKIDYNPSRRRRVIGVLEGTLHAREWISPAVVTWIIKEFLTSNNPEIRSMAESLEWHMIPVANPDGYVYTFTTRIFLAIGSTANFVSCANSGVADDMSNGVDLNRNFDFVWMSVGASDNPCSNTYAGPQAFSEPEARAIASFVRDLHQRGEIIYYISMHSYTQLYIIPYSHVNGTGVLEVNNFGDLFEIAIRSAERSASRHGTHYRAGISADILCKLVVANAVLTIMDRMYAFGIAVFHSSDKMSGSSFDWVKHETDAPVSMLIELRDLGEYGFLLPPEQIIPNSLEIMDGMVEMDKITRLLGYYEARKSGSLVKSFSVIMIVLGIIISILH